MAEYQSLYRKHRPQTFGAVVGQDHVTTALRNAVREGRAGHAYLFSGPRGTGKTTTARILAKALNCLDLQPEGEPCGECENCVAIAEGRFLDLFELDAASNNSVDNIRDLTDRVHLGLGRTARRKVYLVDEVHMLSAAASNALLKTLEEPPDHVVFVLATTNPEKVLPTIRSRTQHFEFTLLTADQIAGRLRELVAAEGVEADDEALGVIARAGAGSARDAESLLDRAIAHSSGPLDPAVVTDLFGSTPFDTRAVILEAIAAEDSPGVLVALGELLDTGHEPRRIAEDLLRTCRDAFLLNAAGDRARVEASPEQQERLRALGAALGNAVLVRVLEMIGKSVVDMRGTDAADPRLVLEIALVRLTRRDAAAPVDALVERLDKLERAVAELRAGGGTGPSAPPIAAPESSRSPGATIGALRKERTRSIPQADAAPPSPPSSVGAEDPPVAGTTAPTREGRAVDVDDVIVVWSEILPALPVATRNAVQEAQPLRVEKDVIVFGVPPKLIDAARPRFKREADTIRDALSERLGRKLRFNLVPHDFGGSGTVEAPPPPPEPDDDFGLDPGELVDAPPGDAAVASFGLLTESLGASVVEERPRE
jgi:DNA polymerase III subunit gamma/tau